MEEYICPHYIQQQSGHPANPHGFPLAPPSTPPDEQSDITDDELLQRFVERFIDWLGATSPADFRPSPNPATDPVWPEWLARRYRNNLRDLLMPLKSPFADCLPSDEDVQRFLRVVFKIG
jgi:hypothetical protein